MNVTERRMSGTSVSAGVRYDSQMTIVSVLYPLTPGSPFNFDYYLATHIPMVKDRLERFGLKEIRLMRGAGTLDDTAPTFELIAELVFPSPQHVQEGLGAHGNEIMGDIPMFTHVKPTIQINEAL